jgi:hypothetical protein
MEVGPPGELAGKQQVGYVCGEWVERLDRIRI